MAASATTARERVRALNDRLRQQRISLSSVPTLPPSWVAVLRASRGIYLLTCPRTKEQYVGSATGEDGFFGRWRE